jgi:hypothetical protein
MGAGRRERGYIERRGNAYRIKVYAGIDPLTGKRLDLTETTDNAHEAERIRTRLLAGVDARRNGRTRGTQSVALDTWLNLHEVEETTLESYRGHIERTIRPALGDTPVAAITVQVLETLYAELRRCSRRCRGGERSITAQACRTSAAWSGLGDRTADRRPTTRTTVTAPAFMM